MTQLEDLDDDSLIEVLDRLPLKKLFKMLEVNKNMNRLASVKLRVKVKAIEFEWRDYRFSDCTHLGAVSCNQVLLLRPPKLRFSQENGRIFESPSQKALFFGLISRCCDVKSVDFINCKLPGDVLLEVVRRCEQIECIKVGFSLVAKEDWNRVLDQVGHRIVHFTKNKKIYDELKRPLPEACLLKMVASKCPNIKRVDWEKEQQSVGLETGLELLPKSCWVALDFTDFTGSSYDLPEDVFKNIDKFAGKLNLSSLGQRIARLSSLYFRGLARRNVDSPIYGVDFANLKNLWFTVEFHDEPETAISFLIASRFPLLERLCFNFFHYFPTEADYESVFQRMPSLKKLDIGFPDGVMIDDAQHLPRSALSRLKNLETIDLYTGQVFYWWRPENLLQLLEEYVDEIRSLKKMIVGICFDDRFGDWKEMVEEEVKRMNLKQDRVKVVLSFFYWRDLMKSRHKVSPLMTQNDV